MADGNRGLEGTGTHRAAVVHDAHPAAHDLHHGADDLARGYLRVGGPVAANHDCLDAANVGRVDHAVAAALPHDAAAVQFDHAVVAEAQHPNSRHVVADDASAHARRRNCDHGNADPNNALAQRR